MADHESVLPEAERLQELHADAAETRADLLLEQGASADAARAMEARRSRNGCMPMAAGLEPSPALRALEGDLLRHDVAVVLRLGLPGNSFVGREVELADLTAASVLQRAARWLRLRGATGDGQPPGCGWAAGPT